MPTQILPWLYLGSKREAHNKSLLQELGITAILNVVGGACSDDPWVKLVPICDYGRSDLNAKFSSCFKFLGN